jgi:hypothetical protein
MWFLIILGFALFWAVSKGTLHAMRSVKDSYRDGKERAVAKREARKDLTKTAVDHGHGKATRKTASTVAAGLGATVTGTRVHLHAAKRGFREGWHLGKAKVLARKNGPDYVPPVTVGTDGPSLGPSSSSRLKRKTLKCSVPITIVKHGGIHQRPCRRRFQAIPDEAGVIPVDCGSHGTPVPMPVVPTPPVVMAPVPTPVPIPINPVKEVPVSDTATVPTVPTEAPAPAAATTAPASSTAASAPSGEVTTMTQLLAELERIQKEATAELDDAKGDAARATSDLEDANADLNLAKAEAAAIDVMVGCLGRPELKLDDESIGEVSALTDGTQDRVRLATARANAADTRLNLANQRAGVAEARLAAATKAHVGIKSRHDLHREAHLASPVAAAGASFYE